MSQAAESGCPIREQLSVHLKKRLHDTISSGSDSCDNTSKVKCKSGKRSKGRKTCESTKKPCRNKEEEKDGKRSTNVSPKSSTATDDAKQDASDSPLADDVFEGSNSSHEGNEQLSMSSLLKVILDRKKKLLLESEEIQELLGQQAGLRNGWVGN